MDKEYLIGLCRRMIQTQSYSGHEDAMAGLILEFMKENNFDEAFTDAYGNVLGCIKGSQPGKRILFDGHIDTVPAENTADWHYPPFAAEIANGRIYGRGTSDMKGADAAMLCAIADFAKKTGRKFAGEIWFAGVVHEECFEGVSARLISKHVRPDLVIIGEASEMNIKCSQRGRAEILLETFGVPCHSSNPDKGVNAVYNIIKAIEQFKALPPMKADGMYGDGIMELTDIISEPYPGKSVLPYYAKATFDRRLLPDETRESVLQPLQVILDALHEKNPDFKGRVSFTSGAESCYTGAEIKADRFFPAWKESCDDPEIQAVYKRIRQKGYTPQLTGYSFCTNGSHYGGEAGIKCIGIGPSYENLAHTTDEYIEIEELINVCDYYMSVCEALL